jgi:hypothetical protein
MQPRYSVGQKLLFQNQEATVAALGETANGTPKYYCQVGGAKLGMWIPESSLEVGAVSGPPVVLFNRRMPHLTIVDNFYKNPDEIRAFALEQHYESDLRFYKGKRTKDRFLWSFLKEEFERILGRPIIDWLNQPANGVFQITGYNDPLVYHSDAQSYAAAIYLTPHAPPSAGTSFWRDKKYGARRPPAHALEYDRYADDAARSAAYNEIYTSYNITHGDNWELVDKVGAIYNRLAIWDAQMIHSASTYEGLESDVIGKARMVQLFFFTVR